MGKVNQVWSCKIRPWFIIGDLNEITGNHEKEGGTLRHPSSFLSFNNMIRDT